MINKKLLLKRLSIIKLLYKIGLEQSRQSETIAFFSILSFHDSIEMFLNLALEHKNKKKESKSFIGYWDILPELELKVSMSKLNSRRVSIKHKGETLSKSAIETSRVNAIDFFDQNTPIIFNMEFSDISLFELIKFKKTKELLITSQEALNKGDIDKCINDVTISFDELLREYKNSKKLTRGFRSQFDFIERVNYGSYNFSNQRNDGTDKRVEDVVNKIDKNFAQIKNVLEVISLGLDYRKYSKFKILTPFAQNLSSGEYLIHFSQKKNWSNENCQFLIDFVLECGLKLQEFDFESETLVLDHHS